MNSLLSIQTLPPAKNQMAAVLKLLIETKGVSERDTPFNGFRSRISELRLEFNLNIRHVKENFVTQFGKLSHYNRHFLLECDKAEAIELYEKINK